MSSFHVEFSTSTQTATATLKRAFVEEKEENWSREKSQSKKLWMKGAAQIKDRKQTEQHELTIQDLKYNFWCVKLLTVLKILPTEMDIQTGRMEIKRKETQNSNSKEPTSFTFKTKFLTTFWSVFVLGRIFSLCADTIFLLKSEQDESESGGLIMLRKVFTAFGTFVCIGLYDGYQGAVLQYMPTANILINALFRNMKKCESKKEYLGLGSQVKDMLKSLVQRPFRVNLLIYLPFLIYSLILVIPGVMILDRKSPILLSSHAHVWETDANAKAEEKGFQLILYIGLAIVDHVYWCFIFSLIYFAVFVMLFFMIRIDQDSETAIKQLRLPNGLEIAEKSLQLIKLQILVFNLRLSSIVYLTKLIALAAAIIGGFLSIKLMHSNPLFTLPFLLFFLEGNILYIVLFNNVYEITRKIDVLKEEILIRAQMQNGGRKKEEYTRICASIQRLGIQAGGFSFMEREATLIFGDFVTQQIVSLLLTFA